MDPYATPKTDVDQVSAPANAPAYKLFTPGHVTLATFLGSPVAGSILMAVNARRLGRSLAAALIPGLLATAALIALGLILPEGAPSFAFPVVSMIAMRAFATALQGKAVTEHQKAGGAKASGWVAAGIAVASLVVVLGAVIGVVVAQQTVLVARVQVTPHEEIRYSDGATRAEAERLGGALLKAGLFDGSDREKTVLLTRNGPGYAISFVITGPARDDPQIIDEFKRFGADVRPIFGGAPVEIRFVDNQLETRRTISP